MLVLQIIYRTLGAVWIFVGSAIMLLALPMVFARAWLTEWINDELPRVADVLRVTPAPLAFGVRELSGMALGAFCVFLGVSLLLRRSWARTLGVAFHIVMGVCVIALTVLVYVQRTRIEPLTASVGALVLAVGGVLALFLIALGFQMSSEAATAAFMGALPALPKPAPVQCPTCGGPLDLVRGRCPKCDTELEEPRSPKRAKLVAAPSGGAQISKEYAVSLRKLNRVGREMPGLDIPLEHRSVSGDHASVEYHQGHFYLHAHDDTFGTYVNGRSVRESEIKHNDLIKFGQAEFRFVVEY